MTGSNRAGINALPTFGSNTDTGTIPLFPNSEVLLPGTVTTPDSEPSAVKPAEPVKTIDLKEAAEDFRSDQHYLLSYDLGYVNSAIRLLDSKKILLPSACSSEFCCGMAKKLCSEHRSDSACANLILCCLIGGSCGVLGFLAKIKGFFCADVVYKSFEILDKTESQSIQDTLSLVNINDIDVPADHSVSQYENLHKRLIRKREELENKHRLRTTFGLFYSIITQPPMPEETREALLATGAWDIVVDYLDESAASPRRLSL